MSKTILITGVSSGFGRALALAALAAGHRVAGTVRSEAQARAFKALHPERAHAQLLDVTDTGAIEDAVAQVERAAGPIDVLVNNAGYGHEGVFEESPLADMRRQFDVNVFGAVAVTKAVLPGMRTRRRGHIINITSMGGTITMPGIAYYCGSKFALEGISDTLAKELAPFNIAVTAVAPGSFRTDWAGRSMVRAPRRIAYYCGSKFALEGISDTLAKELAPFNIAVTAVAPGSFRTDWAGRSMVRAPRRIADYDASFDPIRQAREENSGKQPGDPDKAAQAMLQLIDSAQAPAHLLLGSDALTLVRAQLQARLAEIDAWETLTRSTDG